MNRWLVSVSMILALTAGNATAAGDAEAGKTKSATCMACHGADGNSVNAEWPKLAGQGASYIMKQLQEFKAGVRKNDLMSPMATPLTEQDMQDLAAYFSSQTQNPGVAAAEQVELGAKIYRAGNATTEVAACMACHGPAGSGNPAAVFPRIAGQHAVYIEKALKDFRSDARSNDNAKMMRNVVSRMTDQEIAAVAQYLQGLH